MPLSHAICCRPCLPQALPDSGGALPAGASAVAVISVGCHGSSAQGAAALRCEAAGNSFVSGAPWAPGVHLLVGAEALGRVCCSGLQRTCEHCESGGGSWMSVRSKCC